MAASATVTYDDGSDHNGRLNGVRKVIVDWVSASDGTVSTTVRISGTLVKAVTNPGATAPTDDYDITLTDGEGVNVLAACQSALGNRDATASEQVYFLVLDAAGTPLAQSVHPVVCDSLSVAVTNAGDSKEGRLVLYYKP